MLIAELGEQRTEEIVRGWVANLATDVFSNDTKLLQAIEAGQCQVGIVNTYYFGRLQKENPDIPVAIHWPARGRAGGRRARQRIRCRRNTAREKPGLRHSVARMDVATGKRSACWAARTWSTRPIPTSSRYPLVQAWGEYTPSTMNVAQAGYHQADAVRLMDRAGYR
ncbi:MAG: hypothetical protein U5K76_00305 [Woeseiaceae bacterium]|nr:hypothetical protein [Woeseiaceae bacterium]